MAPKKDKGKESKVATNVFTEVERTFLNLELAECNKKLARLRTSVDLYEQRNEELQQAYDKLDEDRADIIKHLKKTLHVKLEENDEFKEKVKELEEEREIEKNRFKEVISDLEKNFKTLKDQLTSENKILAGKLNTLEEFRALRDDLMTRFNKQEQAFKDQELKYKRIIYEAEKKFVISKDNLKKEMEARLLKVAQDFQDATELRVAASTHRVIRENIAISNELDTILAYQAKLAEQTEKHKENEISARISMELAEEERDKAINKNIVQMKIIDRVTAAYQDVLKDMALYEKKLVDTEKMQATIKKITKENDNLILQVRILEQNLHARLSAQNKAATGANKAIKENIRLRKILKDAAFAVQAALKLDELGKSNEMRDSGDRKLFLTRLLDIISQYHEIQRTESMDTISNTAYELGDLGFVPKLGVSISRKSIVSAAASTTSKPDPAKTLKRFSSKTISSYSKSSSSKSSSSPSSSLSTIPSAHVIPAISETETMNKLKASVQSFVTSSASEDSEYVEEESITEMTETEKKLAQSKLEIQKSIMKDLAYSQMAMHSQAQFAEERRSKSVIFIDTVDKGTPANEGDAKKGESGEDNVVAEIEVSGDQPAEIEENTSVGQQPLEETTENERKKEEPAEELKQEAAE